MLDEVGIAGVADQRVGGFSLGVRQRLALAGALLGEPETLLLETLRPKGDPMLPILVPIGAVLGLAGLCEGVPARDLPRVVEPTGTGTAAHVAARLEHTAGCPGPFTLWRWWVCRGMAAGRTRGGTRG